MASRFSEFLTEESIDPRRLLFASRALERLRPADRAARWKKRHGKKEGGDADKAEEPAKRHSGRPVTPLLLRQAQAGESLKGPQKTRLLRAVNRILEQKKKDPVDLRRLF